MSERSCAAASRAYGMLKKAYAERDSAVAAIRSSGKKCVFMFGDDVPEELIIAHGMFPVRLIGEYGPRPNADKYLEQSFGALWRGYFEKIVNGSLAGCMDYLVLSNSSDIIQKLYYYLLQLARIEPERKLPPIYYIDYSLMVKDFSAQERNMRETREFAEILAEWSGKSASTDELRAAIELCSAHRAALREISRLRRAGKIAGSEAISIIAGSFFMEKADAVALLGELSREAELWPELDCVRAVYTGSLQETGEVYSLFEECGLNIIADDKLIGDRYSDRDVDLALEPSLALSQRYHLRFPSSERGFVAERASCIPELVRESRAEALVVFMNHNDESYIWDLPKQRKLLDEAGIEILVIEDQYYPLRSTETLKQQTADFVGKVRGARA